MSPNQAASCSDSRPAFRSGLVTQKSVTQHWCQKLGPIVGQSHERTVWVARHSLSGSFTGKDLGGKLPEAASFPKPTIARDAVTSPLTTYAARQ